MEQVALVARLRPLREQVERRRVLARLSVELVAPTP
jgi:hypothetical protein